MHYSDEIIAAALPRRSRQIRLLAPLRYAGKQYAEGLVISRPTHIADALVRAGFAEFCLSIANHKAPGLREPILSGDPDADHPSPSESDVADGHRGHPSSEGDIAEGPLEINIIDTDTDQPKRRKRKRRKKKQT